MSFKDVQGYQTALMQQTRGPLAFNYGLAQDALIKFKAQYAPNNQKKYTINTR